MHEEGTPTRMPWRSQKMGAASPIRPWTWKAGTRDKILLIANEVLQAGLSLKDIPVEGITRGHPEDFQKAKEEARSSS